MSDRFSLSLALFALFASVPTMADTFKGGPLEVVLAGEILSLKDSKSGEAYVLKGNKARAQSRVSMQIRGFDGNSLREWLSEHLPAKVQGYFQREDKSLGLVTRFKVVTFALDPASVKCQRDEAPEFRLCTADYALSRSNTVDIPAGESGEHVVALELLPPREVGFSIQMARGSSRSYNVLTGTPTLSMSQFAGLPEH